MGTRKICKSVLIDLSGTLHVGNEITPSAVEALDKLRQNNLSVKFVTNTTKESRRRLHERLCKLGFKIEPHEIWSSLWAARDEITLHSLKPLLLISSDALEDFEVLLTATDPDSAKRGVSLVIFELKTMVHPHIPQYQCEKAYAILGLTKFDGEPNAVVVGLSPDHFEYKCLTKAFRTLLNGASLIAIHEARYYKDNDGELSLGPGPFVKALEYASDCKAKVLGKPCPDFFSSGLAGVDPSEAIMIGDDVRDDIKGAQSLGMRGYLVKTGKYRQGDEDKIYPSPYRTVANFASAVEDILKELVI